MAHIGACRVADNVYLGYQPGKEVYDLLVRAHTECVDDSVGLQECVVQVRSMISTPLALMLRTLELPTRCTLFFFQQRMHCVRRRSGHPLRKPLHRQHVHDGHILAPLVQAPVRTPSRRVLLRRRQPSALPRRGHYPHQEYLRCALYLEWGNYWGRADSDENGVRILRYDKPGVAVVPRTIFAPHFFRGFDVPFPVAPHIALEGEIAYPVEL